MTDQSPKSGEPDLGTKLFPLTAEEQALLDAAPFPNNPENWKWFATAVSPILLECYASGTMDLPRVLSTMRGCSLGCPASSRLMILGMLAERALKTKPSKAKTREYPEALQRFAAGLVEHLREVRTGDKLQTILDESIDWLVAVGICDKNNPIDTGTLHNWYLKHKRAVGDPIVRGRPPEPK